MDVTPFPRALSFLLAAVAAAFLVFVAGPRAEAETVENVNLGDTVEGITEGGIKEVIPFDAVEGTLVDVDVTMGAGSQPFIAILQPDRTPLPGLGGYLSTDSKGRKLKAKKVPLLASGRHFLILTPAVDGVYKARIKGKAPKKSLFKGLILPLPPKEFVVGGAPGALLSIQAKRSGKSELSPLVSFVRSPSGGTVDLALAARHSMNVKADQYKDIPLSEIGTYTVGISTQSGLFGDNGAVKISVKFPKVKAARRGEADVVVDPFVDRIQPSSGFDNRQVTGITLEGDFFGPGPTVQLLGSGIVTATSVVRTDDTELTFDLDLDGLPTGPYDVVVSFADGASGSLVGGFQVLATPLPEAISPPTGFDNRSQAFTVTGTRFQPGLSVAAVPTGGGSPIPAAVGTTTTTSTSVSLPLLDAPLGTFDILVTNPDGGQETLAAALTITRGPRLASATPLLGHDNDAARALAVSGSYVHEDATGTLLKDGSADIPGIVSGLGAGAFTATFDLRGAASGSWVLSLTNPDGGTITLATPFTVALYPRFTSMNPARGFDGDLLTGVVATGSSLVAGAQLTFERSAVTTLQATAETVGGGGATLTFDADLTGLVPGTHDVRLANPDGGTELYPGPFRVLGLRTLTTGYSAAGAPSFAFNAEDDEYLAVYAVSDGSQWDIRGQRFSGETGEAVGAEISITSVANEASGTEDQTAPSVAYSDDLDVYLVVYAWADANAAGDKVKVRSQFVNRDGTLHTAQSTAHSIYTATSGVVSRPRVAWDRDGHGAVAPDVGGDGSAGNWLLVWSGGTGTGADVLYRVFNEGFDAGGTIIPLEVASGILISTTHSGTDGDGNPVEIADRDQDPDVAYSPATGEFLVTYTWDDADDGNASSDIRARFFDDDFTSGPVSTGDRNDLGNVSGKNEDRSRVALDSANGRFLVAWDFDNGGGAFDVRCWLVDAATRARVGLTETTVETDPTNKSASRPDVVFDPTGTTASWLLAYALNSGTTATSSIILTRIPVDEGASGLGTATHGTVAPAAANTAYSGAAVAVRGTGTEVLAGWIASGSAKAPVNAEVRFTK